MAVQEDDRPAKRRKLDESLPKEALAPTEHLNHDSQQKGLDRAISPPPSKRRPFVAPDSVTVQTWGFDNIPKGTHSPVPQAPEFKQEITEESTKYVSSPFQLTQIRDLAPRCNVDAVGLKDILGSPMIKECWNFNFLFDIDFVM
jgi:tyrosyl-DNA phosphodiesterase-1